MPPPYTADKRIRDLNSVADPLLNMVLPIDAGTFLEANKITLQQIVDIVSPSVSKQIAYAGNTAPDNALGNNGDFAFRVPSDGSALQMYQKVSGAWASVFNLPISSISTQTSDPSNLAPDGDTWYLPVTIPTGKNLGGVHTVTGGVSYFPSGLQLTEDGLNITGFLNNTMDSIVIKFI